MGYTWDNEQESSHTDAQADTHRRSTDRPTASACLSCMNPTAAILTRKMHLTPLKIFFGRTLSSYFQSLQRVGYGYRTDQPKLRERVRSGLLHYTGIEAHLHGFDTASSVWHVVGRHVRT